MICVFDPLLLLSLLAWYFGFFMLFFSSLSVQSLVVVFKFKKNGIRWQSLGLFAASAAGHGGQQWLASLGGDHPAGGGGGGSWGVRWGLLLCPQRGGCGHSFQLREYIVFYNSFLIRFFLLMSVSELDFELFILSDCVSMTWHFPLVGNRFCASLLDRIFCGVEFLFFFLGISVPLNCVSFLFCWNSLDLVRTYFTILYLWEAVFDL